MLNRFVVELFNVKLLTGNLIQKYTDFFINSLIRSLNALRLREKLIALAALSLCGCAGFNPQGGVVDPSIAQSHDLCGPYDFDWNGTNGRVYHPSGSDCDASVYSPLVVIFHAAGIDTTYTYTDYDYLQEHLARNGFISVTIDGQAASTGSDNQIAMANKAWDFVEDFLWSTWSKRFYINPGSIGIIGHSRGGATARYLAQILEESPLFQVKSVVSLAPASAEDFITGQQTTGYLSIYGTADGDTAPERTFGHYDQAGNDNSQRDPGINTDILYKAMKLVETASHKGFSDLGSELQRDLTKGYVLAFMKQHNSANASWYEAYIRGDAVPSDWSEDVFTQYSDGFYRRVIDHFDDGDVANTTLGGNLTTFNATAQVLDLNTASSNYVHDTHALWTWGAPDGAAVSFSIPPGKRDASEFKWLSLRIGQTSGDPANDLRIQIRNDGVWSPEVRLTNYGPVVQPTEMCWGGFAAATCQTRQHMATIRVPLTAFAGHENIDFVRIRFRGDAIIDTFIIDNLEFSEWIYEPFQTTI